MSILTTDDLPGWEGRGCQIELSGRGDPVPEQVIDLVRLEHRKAFKELLENCIEVGIADMYGAPTDQPGKYLKECLEIIRRSGVALPSFDMLAKYRKNPDARGTDKPRQEDFWWGEPITRTDLKEILEFHDVPCEVR